MKKHKQSFRKVRGFKTMLRTVLSFDETELEIKVKFISEW